MKVVLKRNTHAKRASIKIRSGEVILTVPKKGCIDGAFKFLNRHLNSLNNHVAKYRQVNFVHGNVINILGKEYIITRNYDLQKKLS